MKIKPAWKMNEQASDDVMTYGAAYLPLCRRIKAALLCYGIERAVSVRILVKNERRRRRQVK